MSYIDSACQEDHIGCANPACGCPCHADSTPDDAPTGAHEMRIPLTIHISEDILDHFAGDDCGAPRGEPCGFSEPVMIAVWLAAKAAKREARDDAATDAVEA